ncbi:MAG TPA: hypothetical protein VH327_03260 [Gammaproteobacteria bacterium]|jgi:hypothetical protein|nr:hypothetical protein [Gammaproteobacteria bacterium]
MRIRTTSRLSALLLGLGFAVSAWAGHDHHAIDTAAGNAAKATAPSGGHAPPPGGHASAPGGHAPMPPPHGGGYWRAIPPAAPHGAYFAAGRPGHFRHDWGHGDIRYFHDRDFYAWHGGYWHHSWYGGRFGWWWVVSGVWFFYPVPVYPYPDPYVPSGFAAPPPPEAEDAPPPASDQFWYFCPASNAYYPYVPACPTGWQQVPANADPEPQPSAPPPPGG